MKIMNTTNLSMTIRRIAIMLFLFCSFTLLNAQTYTLNSNLGTITTCGGTFVDGGGAGGNYANNSDYTVTFCSGSSQLIYLDFSVLNVESGYDFLEVYDGPSTASPLLDNISGNIGTYIIQSSGSCITFHFTSDGLTRRAGWEAIISCVTPCTTPTAGGVSTNQTSPIKVCTNEAINFSGASSTAGGGFSIANYSWDFADGTTGSGVTTSHSYSTPGQYIVQLDVTDNNGCQNTNRIDLVVQVGTVPTFTGTTTNQTVCSGQQVCLTGVVNPTPWADIPTTVIAGTTPLPDGSGICYNAPLTFTEFGAGVTITNANQIDDIFASIEHTWAGDLTIDIVCPNGQSVGLFNSDGTWNTTNISSENFGNPGTSTGYQYIWTSTGQTMDAWAGANGAATTIPAGTYGSEEPYSGLVGCPLNGTWQLKICDTHSIDDGTVFSWGINFDPSLYAGLSGFTPTFNTNCAGTSWSGTNAASNGAITSTSANCNQVCITPPSVGTYTYEFSGVDDFGCSFDTTITVTATTGPTANAGADVTICSGATANLGAAPVGGNTYSWSPTIGLSNSAIANPTVTLTNVTSSAVSTNYVLTVTQGGCTSWDTVRVTVNPQPVAGFTPPVAQCLTGNSFTFNNTGSTGAGFSYSWNFGGGGASPATSTAVSPSGVTYTTPGTYTVTQTITFGTCTATTTANVTINPMPIPTAVADSVNCNGGSTGSVTVSNVTNSPGGFNYSWNTTPVQNTQTATGLPIGIYTVTVTDQNTLCQGQTTATISQPVALSATENHVNPTCAQGTNGTATANPLGGTTPYTYSWNTTPIQTTQTATGLTASSYTCTITDYNGCTTTTTAALVDPAGMVLNTNMTPADCGLPTGSATVSVTSGGSGNFTYSWNTVPVQNTASATNILGGTYIATVTDVTFGCVSTDTITVTTTTGITANAVFISDALCNGSNDGQAYAFPTGGSPNYSYSWNTVPVQTNDTITAAAGTYTVTITDGTGCTGTANVSIGQPTVVVASITGSANETCLGANNGTATAGGSGGSGAYTYSWNTTPVQTTQTATVLAPGSYIVTVFDVNMCPSTANVTINPGPSMSASHTSTNVSCFGGSNGSINVTVGGAPGAITYNWMPGSIGSEDPIGLAAGTYTLTATSLGCSVNDTVIITQPTQLVAVLDSTSDVVCAGEANGQAFASVSGGTGVINYSWNTTPVQTITNAIDLAIGVYTLTATDANGCQTTVNATINEPAPLAVSLGSFDAYCGVDQGTVWAFPTNGLAPYTYVWDTATIVIGSTDTLSGLYPGAYNIQVQDANNCKFFGNTTVGSLPGGTASISNTTNVSCFGGNDGTATVSMSGAFPPYTYQWDAAAGNQTTNPATNLAAGTYSVDVTDSYGCLMTTSATITEPTQLSVSITVYDKICFNSCDAYADAIPSGGTSSYSYSWNDPASQVTPSATSLCPGAISVVITDSEGCTATASATISNPAEMIVTTSFVGANCNQADGSATANVTANGIAPFTYEWSDGTSVIGTDTNLVNVAAGTYFVSVTDSLGCVVTETVTVPNSSGPQIDSTSFTDVLCFGDNNGTATVSVSGGATPYTYLWNDALAQTTPSATNLVAGTYIVNVTDTNGCNLSTSIVVNEPTQLTLTSGGTNPTCFGYNDGEVWVNAIGGTMPYVYSWDDPLAQSNDTAFALTQGTYTATVIDDNGCIETTTVILTDPALFTVNVTGTDVSCFGENDGSATVSENNGFAPFTYLWNDSSTQTTQTASGLIANTYNVVVTDDDGCIANGSIIINEPTELIISQDTVLDVSCNGLADGFASVNVLGGSGAYSFTWDLAGTIVSTVQSPNTLVAGTYLVTVSDTNGCTDQIFITVNEPSPLDANFVAVDVLCAGDNSGYAFVTSSGGTSPYSYQWDAAAALQQTDTASGLVAGTYSAVVTDDNGCTFPINGVVINEPTPLIFVSSTSSPSFCGANNGSASVSVGGGSGTLNYTWNSTPAQFTALASNLVAGNYTVVVTDQNGCLDSTNVNVIDLGAPTVTIPTSTNVSCNGAGDGTATADVTGGIPPYTYEWNTTPTQNTITATGLNAQTYSVTVTDSNGCVASASITIQQANALVAVIGTPTDVSCNGGNDGEATVMIAGGIAPFTYQWNDATSQTTTTASNLIAGTYIVQVADSNNCLALDTVTITEPDVLLVGLDSLKNVNCFGGSDGFIDVNVTGGTFPYISYSWTPNISSGQTASGLSVGNYSVIVTDNNGCTATNNFNISEPTQMVITLDSVPATCGNFNGSAEVTSTLGGTSPYTYSWNDPANQQTVLASNLAPNNYTVTVTDNNNCVATGIISVINLSGPIIDSISTTNVLCNGDANGSATVFASGGSSLTYTWTPSGQITQQAAGLAAGVYSVTVTDANGCSSTQGGIIITQPTALTADINMPATACYGQIVQLFGTGNGGTPFAPPANPYNILWGPPFSTTSPGPLFDTVTSNTTYSIVVQDANGCNKFYNESLVVGSPLVISSSDATICQGNTATINASATGGNSNNPFTYTWLVYDSLTSTTSTPSGVTNPINPAVVNPTTTTDYMVYVSDGCSRNDTTFITVNVNDTTVATIVSNTTTGCPPLVVDFKANGDLTGAVLGWDFDGDGAINQSTVLDSTFFEYNNSGTYDVILTITNQFGCVSSILSVDHVTVYSNPVADFSTYPQVVTILDPVFTFTDESSLDVINWNWNFGDLTTDLINQNPIHQYQDTGFYPVTLIVTNGFCQDTVIKYVQVKPDFFFAIPNTFTPDEDGLNDIFKPGSMVGVSEKDYNFYIFDRWGEKIWEGHDITDGWDGTVKGGSMIAQTDTYVWLIELKGIDGLHREYRGHVNLLK